MILKDLFTENDDKSYCPIRSAFVVGFFAIIGFTLKDIFSGQHFIDHAAEWIRGMGEYLGFGGGAVSAKSYTETKE